MSVPNFSLSLEALRAMTRAQIRAAIDEALTPLTKRELIAWLIETDSVEDTPIDTYKNGQIVRRVEITRDPETGARMRGRVTTWTYYVGGEVNIITISERDSADQEKTRKRIKHYKDGRQPEEI